MLSNNIKKVFLLLIFSFTASVNAEVETTDYTQRYIVQLKENTNKEKILREGIDGREVNIIREFDSIHTIIVEFTDGFEVDADLEDENVETIVKDRLIKWIDPIPSVELEIDAPRKLTVTPGVKRIGADTSKVGSSARINAIVAIIDSGIDAKHKSLNVIKQVNFVSGESSEDLNGHGTHVAGSVACKNSENGVFGVAPGAKLIALKVLDEYGRGWNSDIIAAIDWVTEHSKEIDVVNMSLGGYRGADAVDLMHEAIKKSVAKGVVYVAAAGNDGLNIFYDLNNSYNQVPASYPEVMTVSAMVASDGVAGGYGPSTFYGKDDRLAFFSNYSDRDHPFNPVQSPGACIDVAAPGVDILSTAPGNKYQVMSGTSMASPHVAGAVARYIAENRSRLFPQGVKDAKSVYKIRQAFIDRAEPQESWNKEGTADDPDPYHEGLIRILDATYEKREKI